MKKSKENAVHRRVAMVLLISIIGVIVATSIALADEKRTEGLPEDTVFTTSSTDAPITEAPKPIALHTDEDLEMLAKVIYTEARGCTKSQQEAVVWCVLNRVDSPNFPATIPEVITQKNQFAYYDGILVSKKYVDIARTVVNTWENEKIGIPSNSERVLEKKYVFFYGDGYENHFYEKWGERDDIVTP